MQKFIRQLLCGAAVAAAAMLPQAHATVIDFEGDSLIDLYAPGDSFEQFGYVMTTYYDFATVDTAASMSSAVAPTGNSTQFYFASNEAFLSITRQDGAAFSLDGFSVAFVPQNPPVVTQQTAIVAAVYTTAGAWKSVYAEFPVGSTAAFDTYNLAGFSDLSSVTEVQFYACAITATTLCADFTDNNAQFALDNIQVTAVPEPATTVLFAAGLIGLALRGRRVLR